MAPRDQDSVWCKISKEINYFTSKFLQCGWLVSRRIVESMCESQFLESLFPSSFINLMSINIGARKAFCLVMSDNRRNDGLFKMRSNLKVFNLGIAGS
jgi:hypothetical protein